jgi:hypothetical protein
VRLAARGIVRARAEGLGVPWVMAMDWIETLFLHWRVDAQALRPRIPDDLAIDTYDGDAWVSIVAFRIAGARPRGLPPALAWHTFPEINVRTYVTGASRPGVWFFSLDAHSRFAVALGRGAFSLPYRLARITLRAGDDALAYECTRTQRDAPSAGFAASARAHGAERAATPGSLDHFLAERLAFYTRDRRGRTRRCDVAHAPWPLRDATAAVRTNTLLPAAGIDVAAPHALAHVSRGVRVRAWPLR